MPFNMRVFGWLFLGMGLIFGSLTALSLMGLFPLDISVFDHRLDTQRERTVFLAVWSVVAVAGLVTLRYTRER